MNEHASLTIKVAADATVMDGASVGDNVTIGKCALIYPNAVIGDDVFIGPYCIIGEPGYNYYSSDEYSLVPTIIGSGSIIRSHSVIYEDVAIGHSLQTGHHVTIREETRIGDSCSIGTLTDLQGKLKIGNYVRLHSNVHIGQLTIIDDYVWIYPYTVTTNDQFPPIGNLVGSHICQFAQIGAGAVILPGKTIGANSLVGAGSVVTKDVAPETLVVGSPAKAKCSVRDIRNEEGNFVYPWKDFLTQHRGYPWQNQLHNSNE